MLVGIWVMLGNSKETAIDQLELFERTARATAEDVG